MITNIEKEKLILASLLFDAKYAPLAQELLTSADFSSRFRQELYTEIVARFRHDIPFTLIALQDKFQASELVDIAAVYNTEFITEYSFTEYAKDLKKLAQSRVIYSLAFEIQEKIKAGEDYELYLQKLLNIEPATLERPQQIREVLDDYYDEFFKEHDKPILSGIAKLDQATGGFHRGSIVTIAARTGIGKSNLALQLTLEALKQGQKALFISLEMTRVQIISRLLAMWFHYPAWKLRNKAITDNELFTMTDKLYKNPMFQNFSLMDTSGITSANVHAIAFNHQKRHGLDMLVIDYLSHLNDPRGRGTEEERLTGLIRNLKLVAKQLHIVAITPVQIDKASAQKKEPEVEDAKGSTSLGHEASLALSLVRGRDEEKTTLFITKNRDGESGSIDLNFDKEFLTFTQIWFTN